MLINSIRKEIYDACATLGIPVYDYWVTSIAFPYVIISGISTNDTYYKTNEDSEISIEIHIFVQTKGKTTVVNHIETLKTAFKEIDGMGRQFNARVIDDVAPNVVHGIITFQVKKYI